MNQYIKKEHHHIPSFEELTSDMADAKIFSSLDADSAFWQVKITYKSSNLLTFSTPYGRFKFRCLAYGIKSASEIFQAVFMEIFGDIPGVGIYIDDIKICGRNQEEHDSALKHVLERAREYNNRFNKKKCIFSKNEIKYMGHILSSEGIKIDNSRVQAIQGIQPPKNKQESGHRTIMLTKLLII